MKYRMWYYLGYVRFLLLLVPWRGERLLWDFTGQYLAVTILIFVQSVKDVRKVFIAFISHVRSFIWNVRFFSYSNKLEMLKVVMCVYSDLSISVEHRLSTASESSWDKVWLTILCFDFSLFAGKFWNKFACTMILFYLSSSVELTFKDGAVIFV